MDFKEFEKVDYSSADAIAELQWAKLKEHLAYINSNSAFYQSRFKKNGVDVSKINSVEDLQQIEPTTKKDLFEFNAEFLCADPEDLVEIVTTSGTTGKPIPIALTASDIERLAYNEARSLQLAGISKKDIVQITATLDKRFMAGMAYYLGLNKLGATSLRTGLGFPAFQWENIAQFKPTALIGVPSFFYKLGEFGAQKETPHSVTKAICIGETLRNADFSDNNLTKKLGEYWDIDFRSTYASTEMATAFTECEAKKGGHLLPELIILELLDEEGNAVADGELGEITVTPLGITGMPLLRFRTGDLARKYSEPCSCGRNTTRLGPLEGRKEQMIKLKGTTIFAQQIDNILQSEKDIDAYVIELSSNNLGLDDVTIYFGNSVSEERLALINDKLVTQLRVTPRTVSIADKLLKSMLFPDGSRKPMKIIDVRDA